MLKANAENSITLNTVKTKTEARYVSRDLIFERMEETLKTICTGLAVNYIDLTGYNNGANPVAPANREQYLPELMICLKTTEELTSNVLKAVRFLKKGEAA